MQALSLAVHIPIVCFGIAFPAMFLFVHGLYLRTGEPHYKALAKRWSKVALILFAVGVVTGTILSFEFGLLWPDFMATFGEVFGLAFGLEGISFFVEAIFIAIYVYGWDRLPRAHALPHRHPDRDLRLRRLVQRDRRQRLDEQPAGLRRRRRPRRRPAARGTALLNDNLWHELVHMYLAGYIVAGFIVAGVYARARLRGGATRYHRTGLVVALSFAALAAPVQVIVGDWAGRQVAENQPVKLAAIEGLPTTTEGAPFTIGGFYDADDERGDVRDRDPEAALAARRPRPERDGRRARHRCRRDGPAAGQHRALRVPGDGRDRHACWRCSAPSSCSRWWRRRRLPRSPWFYRAVIAAGPLVAGRADRGLDHDRGRAPAVDRLRDDAHVETP